MARSGLPVYVPFQRDGVTVRFRTAVLGRVPKRGCSKWHCGRKSEWVLPRCRPCSDRAYRSNPDFDAEDESWEGWRSIAPELKTHARPFPAERPPVGAARTGKERRAIPKGNRPY